MIPLSELSPLRRARAQALQQIIGEHTIYPLDVCNHEICDQRYGLVREDVDRAVDDLANAELITLDVHKSKICLWLAEEADHGNSP